MSFPPDFPIALFREANLTWELSGVAIGGGQSASGVSAVTRLDGGGLWQAKFAEIWLYTAAKRRGWRALSAIADGGVQPLVVQVRETFDAPFPVVSGSALASLPLCTFSDGATFSDGGEFASSTMSFFANATALLRSTSLVVKKVAGSALQGGEYFAIDHITKSWRLYRIATAIDNGDGTFNVTFRPPLREAIAANTLLDFDRPRCVMRLASVSAMDAVLEPPYNATVAVNFVEAFPPFPD